MKRLFGVASELSGAERSGFVDRACGADVSMRERLFRLLHSHDRADGFLEHPAALIEAAAVASPTDDGVTSGDEIGRYVLEERLGAGAHGCVWRARQRDPVVRSVAMKLLDRGLGSDVAKACFEREAQVLARMEHPAIAKVFDAGTTSTGRPWLAMELFAGRPITVWCVDHELPLRERLELFVEVCDAVQHAHGKGIVHRDLKPSNILVAERDGRARPVVIDFGIALALGDAGIESRAAALGTPEYMSPELLSGDGADVDVRADVYSLGVVLYELAVDVRPYARAGRTLADGWELLRRVREETPEPPSRRATRRRAVPRDLDWIVGHAMSRSVRDRYPTVAALADDVVRLLRHEAVLAVPQTPAYRARRFVRRHWFGVAASAAVLVSAGFGTFAAVRGRLEAERQGTKAVRAFAVLDELWDSLDPLRLGAADYPVRELLNDFEVTLARRHEEDPEVELRVLISLSRKERLVGEPGDAMRYSGRAVELADRHGTPDERVHALRELAYARLEGGVFEAGAETFRRAIAALDESGRNDPLLADLLDGRARCLVLGGHAEEALAAAEKALALRCASDPDHVPRSELQLAMLNMSSGRTTAAMSRLRAAQAGFEKLDPREPDALAALQHLAALEQQMGDLDAAEKLFRQSLARRREVFDGAHPLVAWAEADLAWLLHARRSYDEAATLLGHALPALRERLGEPHPFVTEAMQRRGASLGELKRLDESEPLLVEAERRSRTLPQHTAASHLACASALARLRWLQGSRSAALEMQTAAIERDRREVPDGAYAISAALTCRAGMKEAMGDLVGAAADLREALAMSEPNGRAGEAEFQRKKLEVVSGKIVARCR